LFVDALDRQLTAGLRLVLGLTLLVSSTDHTNAVPLPPVLAASLVIYLAYAAVAYAATLGKSNAADSLALFFPADAAVFLLLTALADADDQSIAYSVPYLFLFAVMGASFAWGSRAGQRLTMGIAGLFFTTMLLQTSVSGEVQASRTVLQVISILALGTMASRWGGYQFTVYRRLALLRDVSTLPNPRFGVDRMMATVLERLRKFCGASVCLLVSNAPEDGTSRVYRSAEHSIKEGFQGEELPAELRDSLEWLPRDALAVYARNPPTSWWLARPSGCLEQWRHDGHFWQRPIACQPARVESWLASFGGRAWLSVPVFSGPRWIARLHITGNRPFDPSEAEFVLQVIERGMVGIENVRLVDRLASTAAQRERHRIARDIHDSVIQPYIGLQYGLTAVERRLRAGNPQAAHEEVSRLLGLTSATIEQLRGQVGALKSETDGGADELMLALRRYAERFAEDHGIIVDVVGDEAVRCGDRLGAELFQMAVEGLSNVRRHTIATHAAIRLLPGKDHVTLQVENQEPGNGRARAFTPKSITERAAALGGRVTVDHGQDGRTLVEVRIPL
jgi:signal transduction histidine kinase